MIGVTLAVTMRDGSKVSYGLTPRVAVDFERHYKTSLTHALRDDQKVEHLYYLGWLSMKGAGTVVKLFDSWLDEVESVTFEADAPKA